MKSKIRILAKMIYFLLFLVGNIYGQESSKLYEYITFKEFLSDKVENDTNFVKEIYKNVKCPISMRTIQIETNVEVLVISHPRREYEVIISNQPIYFEDLENEILKALFAGSIDQKTPFITRFKLAFSIDKVKFPKEKYRRFHLGLLNNNTFSIVCFAIPDLKPEILISH